MTLVAMALPGGATQDDSTRMTPPEEVSEEEESLRGCGLEAALREEVVVEASAKLGL